jgi:hypothetical protein
VRHSRIQARACLPHRLLTRDPEIRLDCLHQSSDISANKPLDYGEKPEMMRLANLARLLRLAAGSTTCPALPVSSSLAPTAATTRSAHTAEQCEGLIERMHE